MEELKDEPYLEDDSKETEIKLVQHRLPWLLAGLFGGLVLTIFSSYFENLLEKNLQLVFFIPVIVYMSGAVGTQTETIYIRNIGREKVNFSNYIFKEFLTGISLGAIFGGIIYLFALIWLKSQAIASTVGLAMFVNVACAPLLALFIARILQKERADPALGAGPFTTVIEDLVSLGIYFLIASVIIFR